jgi:hypothetical protein
MLGGYRGVARSHGKLTCIGEVIFLLLWARLGLLEVLVLDLD